MASWLDTRTNQSEVAQLNVLFDKYVPPCLEALKTKFKKITPLPEINHIQFLCYLLECLLIPANVPNDCPKEWYEIYFAWACVWAFGSSMFQDQVCRNSISIWLFKRNPTRTILLLLNHFSSLIGEMNLTSGG